MFQQVECSSCAYSSDSYDVAVIVLDEPNDPGAFAALPSSAAPTSSWQSIHS